jgi:hypothetical protein
MNFSADAAQERPRFEAHARKLHPEISLTRQPLPQAYEDAMAKALWDAWMASASVARQPRMFPIVGAAPILWSAIAACEPQVVANHGLGLEPIAAAGGLNAFEALDALRGHRAGSTLCELQSDAAAAAALLAAFESAPAGMAETSPPALNLGRMKSFLERAREQSAGPEQAEGFEQPATHATVAREPSPALLVSMAMRFDHALAMPNSPSFSGISDEQRRQKAVQLLIDMRRAHEEVVGTGFHHPEREQFYLDALAGLGISPDEF